MMNGHSITLAARGTGFSDPQMTHLPQYLNRMEVVHAAWGSGPDRPSVIAAGCAINF
jgi:hypothetical protein